MKNWICAFFFLVSAPVNADSFPPDLSGINAQIAAATAAATTAATAAATTAATAAANAAVASAPTYTDPQAVSAVTAAGFLTPSTGGPIKSMNGGRTPSLVYALSSNVVNATTSPINCFNPSAPAGLPGPVIPAGVAYAGNTFHLVCRGVYSTGALNVSGAVIKVVLGSTEIASVSTLGFPASLSAYQFTVDVGCQVQTVATTSATINCVGTATFWTAVAGNLVAPPSMQVTNGTTTKTFDPRISNAFQITSALTSLIGSPSVTATYGTAEILY